MQQAVDQPPFGNFSFQNLRTCSNQNSIEAIQPSGYQSKDIIQSQFGSETLEPQSKNFEFSHEQQANTQDYRKRQLADLTTASNLTTVGCGLTSPTLSAQKPSAAKFRSNLKEKSSALLQKYRSTKK